MNLAPTQPPGPSGIVLLPLSRDRYIINKPMNKILLLVAFIAAIIGCSKPARRYHLNAEVISVEPPRALIVVKHGEIPGLMPAMTMQYSVADPKQIENLRPGDKITADLVVRDNKGQLENITLVTKAIGS